MGIFNGAVVSEMEEQVAQAMKDFASRPFGNLESGLNPTLVGSLGVGWAYLARAAIEAMREPTEAMVDAGNREAVEYSPHTPPAADAESCWQEMIDEALKTARD